MLLRLWVQNGNGLYPLNECTKEDLTMLNHQCMIRYRRPALFMARSLDAVRCLMEVGGLSLQESTFFLNDWTAFNMFLYLEEVDPVHCITDHVLSFATKEDLMRLDSLGKSAIFQATTLERLEWIVKQIEGDDISREMVLNAVDHSGQNLLMKHPGNATITDWLITNGVELNHQDNDGCTFLMYLVEHILEAEETLQESYELLRKALAQGADPDLENNKGVSVSTQLKSILESYEQET